MNGEPSKSKKVDATIDVGSEAVELALVRDQRGRLILAAEIALSVARQVAMEAQNERATSRADGRAEAQVRKLLRESLDEARKELAELRTHVEQLRAVPTAEAWPEEAAECKRQLAAAEVKIQEQERMIRGQEDELKWRRVLARDLSGVYVVTVQNVKLGNGCTYERGNHVMLQHDEAWTMLQRGAVVRADAETPTPARKPRAKRGRR